VTSTTLDQLAGDLRAAFDAHNLASFGALLADDVWWGDDDHAHGCRGRADVLATFGRLVGQSVHTELTDVVVGRTGVLAVLQARWADDRETRRETALYHTYFVRCGLICQISRHQDRDAALAAIDG